jgi:hypothetical protein
MSCEFICDWCGKRQPAELYPGGWFKPSEWYQRRGDDGAQVACSRECIDKIAAATGKTSVVLPI